MLDIQLNHSLSQQWSACKQDLQSIVSGLVYHTWLQGINASSLEEGVLHLSVPTEFILDWVPLHYSELILGVAQKFISDVSSLDFSCNPETTEAISAPALVADSAIVSKESPKVAKTSFSKIRSEAPALNRNFTFSHFVEGECNRAVLRAAQIVADSPGQNDFNPFVIYGETGLGKSHLLQAIGHYAWEHETCRKVVYKTSEQLMSECIEYMRKSKTVNFKALYHGVDLLLIDDIQFMARSRETVIEFTNLFALLKQSGRQVVITCDKYPHEVQDHKGRRLHNRLLSGLESGLITNLGVPSEKTRRGILQQKQLQDSSLRVLSDEVLDYISSRACSNVRELEGMMLKVFAFHSLMKSSISLDVARRILGDTVRNETVRVTLSRILEEVSSAFDVAPELLVSQSRKKGIAVPRKVAMYLCRALTDNSLHTIGLKFNRDYSTVIFSIKTLMKALEKDSSLEQKVSLLKDKLRS